MFDEPLANAEDRARRATERLSGLCIAPIRPFGIDLEQYIRMFDLLRRRLPFAHQVFQQTTLFIAETDYIFLCHSGISFCNDLRDTTSGLFSQHKPK